MDVQRLQSCGFLILLVLLSACGNKTASSVFPESDPNSPFACTSDALMKTRFIVNWEDGRMTVITAENKEVFIQKFLEPNMGLIKHVEFDKLIVLKQNVDPTSIEPDAFDYTSWGQNQVQAPAVWNQGVLGAGVKVGIVDAAVDYTHPQIKPRLAVNQAELNGQPGVDDDNNGFVDDVYGWDFAQDKPQPNIVIGKNMHGTHVAGIVAADHTKGSIKGMAPQATVVPANFMEWQATSADGTQGGETGSLAAGIAAVKYVALRGVKVINASWGGGGCSQTLKNVIRDLNEQNILFVAAAGNGDYRGVGLNLDTDPEFPAALDLPNQLTIAASTPSDFLTSFSNYSYHYVHLAAPGKDILSTVPGGTTYMDGTSMAAPMVSGAAALLWSDRPSATVAQIRQALMGGVDEASVRVASDGRLNVQKALAKLRELVP